MQHLRGNSIFTNGTQKYIIILKLDLINENEIFSIIYLELWRRLYGEFQQVLKLQPEILMKPLLKLSCDYMARISVHFAGLKFQATYE